MEKEYFMDLKKEKLNLPSSSLFVSNKITKQSTLKYYLTIIKNLNTDGNNF